MNLVFLFLSRFLLVAFLFVGVLVEEGCAAELKNADAAAGDLRILTLKAVLGDGVFQHCAELGSSEMQKCETSQSTVLKFIDRFVQARNFNSLDREVENSSLVEMPSYKSDNLYLYFDNEMHSFANCIKLDCSAYIKFKATKVNDIYELLMQSSYFMRCAYNIYVYNKSYPENKFGDNLIPNKIIKLEENNKAGRKVCEAEKLLPSTINLIKITTFGSPPITMKF